MFYRNPGLIDTIGGVACKIGLNTVMVEPAVENLVASKVLFEKTFSGSRAIAGNRKACQSFLASNTEMTRNE